MRTLVKLFGLKNIGANPGADPQCAVKSSQDVGANSGTNPGVNSSALKNVSANVGANPPSA